MQHQGLVHRVARRYTWALNDAFEYEDLVQNGNLGLIRAAETFESERGFKFSTYAEYWVKTAIGRAIENHGRTIRIPVHAQAKMRAAGRYVHRHGQEVHENDIRSDEDVEHAVDVSRLSSEVRLALSVLLPRERQVLLLRETSISEPTFDDIGASLGISRERVRQLYKRAIRKVREAMGVEQ